MVEPRTENKNQEWPPVHLAPISEGKIVLENKTKKPITTGKDIKIIGLRRKMVMADPVEISAIDSV